MGNRDRDHLTAAGRSNLGRRTFLKLTGTATVVATTGLVGILDSGQAPDRLRTRKLHREALAQAQEPPDVVGQWSALVDLPIVAIHMHLLPDGNVLAWGKPETPPAPSFGVEAAVWDPTLASPTFYGAHDSYQYCSPPDLCLGRAPQHQLSAGDRGIGGELSPSSPQTLGAAE